MRTSFVTLLAAAAGVLSAPTVEIEARDTTVYPTGAALFTQGGAGWYCNIWARYGEVIWKNSGDSVSTIVTFPPVPDPEHKTCYFEFSLPPWAVANGAQQFQLFSNFVKYDGYPGNCPSSSNGRNQHYGTLSVEIGRKATWVADFGGYEDGFPCPSGTSAFELVPKWNTEMRWSGEGATLRYV